MQQHPLYMYVIAVAVVWAIILGTLRYMGNDSAFRNFSILAAGFALGMLAMYIAVHIYSWK